MTPSFAAILWDPRQLEARAEAEQHIRALNASDWKYAPTLEGDGFLLVDLSDPKVSKQTFLPVSNSEGAIVGAIYGTVFDQNSVRAPISSLSQDHNQAICASRGSEIYRTLWGQYVACLTENGTHHILTDPMSAIPCFYHHSNGTLIVFSHLEKCPFPLSSPPTLNLNFIRRLLVYDKIQNGETGLNDVNELSGGQHLISSTETRQIRQDWDPRRIAKSHLDLAPAKAPELLRETVQDCVESWANQQTDIIMDLSGGLDSSIVLSCLATEDIRDKVTVMHHEMQSLDRSERHYAHAVTERFRFHLETVQITPDTALPSIESHPASARPFRQFLGSGFTDHFGSEFSRPDKTFFTGQGGDHLFLMTRSPLVFADYVKRHPCGRETFQQLLNAARLSGKSIWSVLIDSFPYLFGRAPESAMVSGIQSRKTILSDSFADELDPIESLPAWVTEALSLPPAKFEQISLLHHLAQIRESLLLPKGRHVIHPLMSQPIVELCLKLPTYDLCRDGINRGLAREAFRNILPEKIRLRATKGEATQYFMSQMAENISLISDALMDGALVQNGLVSPETLGHFLTHDQYQETMSGRTLLIYYAVEAWMRNWS